MDILKDIKDILIKHKDKEHHLKINIDCYTLTIYLECDPCLDFSEDLVIPICYDRLEGFAYISDAEYREKFKANDYGIDFHEIKIIKDIMEYIENHSTEINELLDGYCWEDREYEDESKEE
jgi:hypothetical protein